MTSVEARSCWLLSPSSNRGMNWPANPVVLEINARVWLEELRRRHGADLTLGRVPEEDLEAIAAVGTDGVWLMGVWERSPSGRAIALAHEGLAGEFANALGAYSSEDVVGSPFAVRR